MEIEKLRSNSEDAKIEIDKKIKNAKNSQIYNENQRKMAGPIIDINQVIGSIKNPEPTGLIGDVSNGYSSNNGTTDIKKTKKKGKAGGK